MLSTLTVSAPVIGRFLARFMAAARHEDHASSMQRALSSVDCPFGRDVLVGAIAHNMSIHVLDSKGQLRYETLQVSAKAVLGEFRALLDQEANDLALGEHQPWQRRNFGSLHDCTAIACFNCLSLSTVATILRNCSACSLKASSFAAS